MPKLIDADLRRQQILARAFQLFADRGYAALSMRDLARSMRVTTGTLYHYFPSKEALFDELVRTRAESDVREATRGLAANATPEERLSAFTLYFLHHLNDLQAMLRLVLDFQQHRSPDDARDFIEEALEAYRAPLRDVFGDDLSSVGLSLLIGLLAQRTLAPERVDLRAHFQGLSALMIR
jgi:AcrR family transcriptional regulator